MARKAFIWGSNGSNAIGELKYARDDARRIRPEDPGRPTDSRVMLVKIAMAEPTPLKLGQRVEVEIGAPRRR